MFLLTKHYGSFLYYFFSTTQESFTMNEYLKSQFHNPFISQSSFILAPSVLTLLVFIIIRLYQTEVLSSIHWVIFIQGAIFFNAVQYLVLFFYYGSYNPGAITVFFICSFSMILLIHILKKLGVEL